LKTLDISGTVFEIMGSKSSLQYLEEAEN